MPWNAGSRASEKGKVYPPKPAIGPSEGTQMTHPIQKGIERRAYQLWEGAGQPKGRDQEFYLEAERQLKEERIRHELKTPDNL
jgi:Protein of unknown function (DUF2934)